MQVIFENENKRDVGGRTNLIDTIICIGEISRYIEGKSVGEFEIRGSRIWINKRVFVGTKEKIWKRR